MMSGHRRDRAERTARVRLGARLAASLGAALAMLGCTAALAVAGPQYNITAVSNTTVAPGDTLDYFVIISNVGDEATPDLDLDGFADDPRTLQVTLPPGVTPVSALSFGPSGMDCTNFTVDGTCTSNTITDPHSNALRTSNITFTVQVDPSATGTLTTRLHQTGGSGPDADSAVETRVSATPPGFGIQLFDGQVSADAAGNAFTQAGGTPYAATTTIFFNTLTNPVPFKGELWPAEAVKDVFVDLPPGFVGNPSATSGIKCTTAELANSEGIIARPLCPPGSQVGVGTTISADGAVVGGPLPVFNLEPPPGVPARFGFNVAGSVVTLDGEVRTGGDYGLSVNVRNIPEGLALAGTQLTFWGVPADSSHNIERACPGQKAPWDAGPSCTTDLPLRPFLRNPTSCTAPNVGLPTDLRVDSWLHPGVFRSASFISHLPPAFPSPLGDWGGPVGTSGCELLPFEPAFKAAPTPSGAVSAPTAFAFDLSLPQTNDPTQIGTADLKTASVTLPAGLRVNPSSAAGLGACTPAQIGLHSDGDSHCPSSSKVGTVTITTPLLEDPLEGSIYLAKPHDNPFDTLLSLYLVARGQGTVVKLAGRVAPDAKTGRLSATFDDNPQLPFSKLHLEFKGGPRAPLTDPPSCGTYSTRAVLTSWSGKTVTSDSTFQVSRDGYGSPCSAPAFSPKLTAGATRDVAGKHTSFVVGLSRDDTDQELSSLTVAAPRGLLAKVAGVPLCPALNAKLGTCPASTRIGSVLTGAGSGPDPFYLPGRVYLTGRYKGGPYGLSIVVPAIAGPFNLGNVVVRASIKVDKRTAQLRVVSDPLPTILEGIPLQVRDIRVTVDRSKFMVNPTSCAVKQVAATVRSTEGKRARATDDFQVAGCAKLPFAPKLTLAVGGKGHTARHTPVPLTAKLTQAPGQSGIASVKVALPLAMTARLDVVTNACTLAQFEAGHCAKARTGSAVAVTPLLSKPLRGSAYFVKDPDKPAGTLPDLIVALRGQVDVDLVGTVTIPGGTRLATTFAAVPDVPITSFTLRLVSSSKHGAIAAAENLCGAKVRQPVASVGFHAQNGAVISRRQPLVIRGCATKH